MREMIEFGSIVLLDDLRHKARMANSRIEGPQRFMQIYKSESGIVGRVRRAFSGLVRRICSRLSVKHF